MIEMKTNPRTTRIFFTLLAHRERHRIRHGGITHWIGRLDPLSDNQLWPGPPLIRLRSSAGSGKGLEQ